MNLLRGQGLNLRPQGYEPCELPLLPPHNILSRKRDSNPRVPKDPDYKSGAVDRCAIPALKRKPVSASFPTGCPFVFSAAARNSWAGPGSHRSQVSKKPFELS